MIRTKIVDYDDQIRQEHEEIEVNDERCNDILTVIYSYLGEILTRCHLSGSKRACVYEAYDFIDEYFRYASEEEKRRVLDEHTRTEY